MESLPNELLDIISRETGTSEKIALSQVSTQWYGIITSRIIPVNNLKDLKGVCIKGDLLSTIRSKCYQWVHKIVEWSLRSGKTEIYDWLVENEYDVSEAWMGCYWGGHLDLIERLFPKPPQDSSEIALRKGHLHLLKLQVSPGFRTELQNAFSSITGMLSTFYHACRTGNLEVVKSMPNFPSQGGITPACRGGHYDLLVYLTQKQIDEDTWRCIQESCIIGACEKGNLQVLNHLISLEVITSWNAGLIAACRKNKIQAAELMIAQGANSHDEALVAACKNGSLEAAKLMYSRGARALDRALAEAVGLDTIKWLIQKGATNYTAAMFEACKSGKCHEVLYLKQFLDPDLKSYRTVAEYHNKKRILKLL